MKRTILKLIALALVILALSVPAGIHIMAREQVTLKILHNWGPEDSKGPALQAIFDEFMAANPNITIETEVLPDTDIPTRVETAFLGGEEPDLVFQNYLAETLDWVDEGVTVPVTGYMTDWGLRDSFLDAAISQYTRADGEIAAFPLEGFNWPIWYNTAIFKAAGVEIPTTMDELITAAQAIRAAGYQPFVVGGGDWTGYRFSQLVLVSGLPEDEAANLLQRGGFADSENALAAMEAFVAMRDQGVFADNVEGLDFATQNEMFYSGKAAMMHGGAWSYAELPEELQDVVVLGGLPLIQSAPYGMPTAWAGFTAKGVHITRNGTEKLDAIEAFVKFLYQPENIARFVEDAGMVPPISGVDVDQSKLNPLFVKSLDLPKTTTFVLLAETKIPASIDPPWSDLAADTYIPGGMSAQEILEELDAIYTDYLE